MSKPIIRLDATPEDLEIIQRQKDEQQRIRLEAKAEWDRQNPPEKLEAERKEKEAENKKSLEDFYKEEEEKLKNYFIDNPKGSIHYGDRVKVVKKTKGCSHADGHLGEFGIAIFQNICKCAHEISDNCYQVKLDNFDRSHHFEEIELEKA